MIYKSWTFLPPRSLDYRGKVTFKYNNKTFSINGEFVKFDNNSDYFILYDSLYYIHEDNIQHIHYEYLTCQEMTVTPYDRDYDPKEENQQYYYEVFLNEDIIELTKPLLLQNPQILKQRL